MRELLAVAVAMVVFTACNPVARLREALREREAQDLLEEHERTVNGGPPIVGEPREYLYDHLETTGLTTQLISPDGGATMIEFSGDSNQESLHALYALAVPVLFPNSGTNIVVSGVIENVVHFTPNHPDLAASEPYRRFRLDGWYLRAPFIRWDHEPKLEDGPMPETLETQLRPADFKKPVSGDLSRFVRVSDAGAAPAPNAPAPESSHPRAP